MDPIPLGTMMDQVGGRWEGPGDPPSGPVQDVSTDSRTVRPGTLFVALRGDRFDGRLFAPEALRRGALAVLVEAGDLPGELAGIPRIEVPHALEALERLALHSAGRTGAERIAITGSVGKTTTKDFLGTILSRSFPVVRAPRSFNNRLGVSLTLLLADRTTRFIVSELGANAPGELDHLSRMVEPSRVIVTEIGPAHLAGFGDLEGVIQAKGEVFGGLRPGGTALINEAAPGREYLARRARAAGGRVALFGWGRGDYRIVECRRLPPGRDLSPGFSFRLRDPGGSEEEFSLGVPGRHNVLNALAAMALARDVGLGWEEIREGLKVLELPPLRLDLSRVSGVTVIDDTYNASRTSVLSALEEAAEIPLPRGGRRFLVLGDLLELGEESPGIHREIGLEAARNERFQGLITVGEESREAAGGAGGAGRKSPFSVCSLDRDETARHLEEILAPGDLVLFKASRGVGLEGVARELRDRLTVRKKIGNGNGNGNVYEPGSG